MYSNIGGKIKTLAQVLCIIGIVLSAIIGIGIMVTAIVGFIAAIGFLTMVVGSLLSWLGSFILYGYGQLIENTDIIVDQIDQTNNQSILLHKSVTKCTQELNDILQPPVNLNELGNMMQQNHPSVGPSSTVEEIRTYKTLMDDGIITAEEFEAKKKQLLNLR